ncbi:expansin EXLX1 family cellulose-binding protein [Luteolibacter marinus]|uniref:expansin EXLX1 family cellulose-binding protein n=1 Tax=Luteolibacter marinus TaxID=2776705 RepID=UPI001866F05F|nr:expansin EXLX1 family cellulose-binding protein [Luteolibacter marinus]
MKPRSCFHTVSLLLRLAFPCAFAFPVNSSGQITPGVTYNGNATTYTMTPGGGAASLPAGEVSDYYAALNAPQWDGSAWGGAWVEVTGSAGTAVVQIVDLCTECPSGALDLGPVPFAEITGSPDGIHPISWRLVSAPGTPGPVHFYSEGSNPFYLKLQAANIVNPVDTMEIFHASGYVSMTRTADNHFTFSPGSSIAEPFTIRLTDIFENTVVSSGLTLAATSTGQNGGGNFPPVSDQDIVVEQPADSPVDDGASVDLGNSIDGAATSLEFTIRNLGAVELTGIGITKDGTDATDFSVTTPPATTLAASAATTFTISFATSTPGLRTAAIHIASSSTDPDLASYDILLTGQGLSTADDTDSDGLNDGAEALMADLGFDWQVSQPDLVNTYYAAANSAGLFTAEQVQALHIDTPLLRRDASSGNFTLTLGLGKSTDLVDFDPFPFALPGLSVNSSGELEYEFSLGDNTAFLRVETK